MSILSAHVIPASFSSEFFNLAISRTTNNTNITLQLLTSTVNTRDLPMTKTILKKNLPSILRSECFNDNHYPFSVEVRCTEIGHLFEHVLLEYLCIEKIQHGCESATYSGMTSWNWREEPRGLFHITIDIGLEDALVFTNAITKTTNLLNLILQTNQNYTVSSSQNSIPFSNSVASSPSF